MIVGVPNGDDAGEVAGEAYVVFGTASGFGTAVGSHQVIDLSTLTAAQGFVIHADSLGDNVGASVSAAGDINDDGYDDLIVGAPWGYHNYQDGSISGEAYVLYGNAFGGSTTSLPKTGTAAADTLVGGRGADVLTGGGGADMLIGGAGNDILVVADSSFAKIRGGGGTDTLAFSGAGMTVDFTTIADNRISGIERLDLTGSGNNTVSLSASDLFHFSNTKDASFTAATLDEALVVLGNAGDVLQLHEISLGLTGTWTQTGTDVGLDGSANGAYDIYQYAISDIARGFVAVKTDVTVDIMF